MSTKTGRLYCLPQDFRDYLEDLPANTIMINALTNPVQLPEDGEHLLLDCEAEIWVRGRMRKYFRKLQYAHFSIKCPGYREDYIIYYIPEN